MMVGEMRWFSKFISEVMNSKLHTTLPPPIRSQEKWKFCIWDCPPMFIESSRTVPPKLHKNDNFHRDFVRRILFQWE